MSAARSNVITSTKIAAENASMSHHKEAMCAAAAPCGPSAEGVLVRLDGTAVQALANRRKKMNALEKSIRIIPGIQ